MLYPTRRGAEKDGTPHHPPEIVCRFDRSIFAPWKWGIRCNFKQNLCFAHSFLPYIRIGNHVAREILV